MARSMVAQLGEKQFLILGFLNYLDLGLLYIASLQSFLILEMYYYKQKLKPMQKPEVIFWVLTRLINFCICFSRFLLILLSECNWWQLLEMATCFRKFLSTILLLLWLRQVFKNHLFHSPKHYLWNRSHSVA